MITLMLPSAISLAIPGASKSVGMSSVALLWAMVYLVGTIPAYTLRRRDLEFLGWPLVMVGLLTVHLLVSSVLVSGHDPGRFVISCVVFLLVCGGTHFASQQLLSVRESSLISASNDVLVSLAILPLAAAAGVPGFGASTDYAKPIVFFSEPSHFALATMPLLLFRMAISKRATQFLLIGAALLIAAIMQSLTMVAGVLFVAALLLRQALLLLLLIPLASIALLMDISYYAERLALTSDSKNLSTLVFLQGWDNALLNFATTHGFGLGFQQFGVAGSTGEISDKIALLLTGDSLSLLDGGTTASKLIGEFGIFGILLLIGFMVIVVRSTVFLRRSQSLPPQSRDIRRMFFCSLIATYTVELFVRGVGYFSPGGFLALVALISMSRMGWQPAEVNLRAVRTQPRPAT
jgi:hypothetical protein